MAKASRAPKTTTTISIIGAGRLGVALARALHGSGYLIEAVVSRRLGRARRARSQWLPESVVPLSAGQLDRLPTSKLTIIATPDDVIAKTAETLARLDYSGRGRTVLHTSGALSSAETLAPLAAQGFNIGSLHPLVSVSDPVQGAMRLRKAAFCLEGDRAAVKVAKSIVEHLGGEYFQIPAQHKPLYHCAALMASGHVVAQFSLAIEMLLECGLSAKAAQRVLLPLLQSSITNISGYGSEKALTGPFARGDLATIEKHLQALEPRRFADARDAYIALGRRSLKLAKSKYEARLHKQILKALDEAD